MAFLIHFLVMPRLCAECWLVISMCFVVTKAIGNAFGPCYGVGEGSLRESLKCLHCTLAKYVFFFL